MDKVTTFCTLTLECKVLKCARMYLPHTSLGDSKGHVIK